MAQSTRLLGQIAEADWPFRPKDPGAALPMEFIKAVREQEANQTTHARLHSKFLIFVDVEGDRYAPRQAVIGSSNFNDNSEHSLECVVSTTEPKVLWALLGQWYQMLNLAMYQRDPNLVDTGVFAREFEEDWEAFTEREQAEGFDAYARGDQWDEYQLERNTGRDRRCPPDWWRW